MSYYNWESVEKLEREEDYELKTGDYYYYYADNTYFIPYRYAVKHSEMYHTSPASFYNAKKNKFGGEYGALDIDSMTIKGFRTRVDPEKLFRIQEANILHMNTSFKTL